MSTNKPTFKERIKTYLSKVKGFFSKVWIFFYSKFLYGILTAAILGSIAYGWELYKQGLERKKIRAKALRQVIYLVTEKNIGEDLKKTAAIGLGLMDRIDIVKENIGYRQGYIEIIEEFGKGENVQSKSDEQLLIELLNTQTDKQLREIDNNFRIRSELDKTTFELRRQLKWYKGNGLSKKEQKLVEDLSVVEKIEQLIDTIQFINNSYLDTFSYNNNFVSITNDFLEDIDEFNQEIKYSGINDEEFYKGVIYLKNNTFNTYLRFNDIEDKIEKIKRYEEIVQKIVDKGLEGAKDEFIQIGGNSEVATTIRASSIEKLGIIGRSEDLNFLIKLVHNDNYEIQISSLRAICMILSNKRSEKNLRKFDLDYYRNKAEKKHSEIE